MGGRASARHRSGKGSLANRCGSQRESARSSVIGPRLASGVPWPRAADTGRMRGSRRTGAFLLAVAIFQWVIWPTFLRNIWRDPRAFDGGAPTRFLLVHAVLTAISLGLGTGVGVVGAQLWRSTRR